jgi:hypothetical protein
VTEQDEQSPSPNLGARRQRIQMDAEGKKFFHLVLKLSSNLFFIIVEARSLMG